MSCTSRLWRSPLASDVKVIRFGQAVAARCWVTSEATRDCNALNGDGQCWLSVRPLCRGTSAAFEVSFRRYQVRPSVCHPVLVVLTFCEAVVSEHCRSRSGARGWFQTLDSVLEPEVDWSGRNQIWCGDAENGVVWGQLLDTPVWFESGWKRPQLVWEQPNLARETPEFVWEVWEQ